MARPVAAGVLTVLGGVFIMLGGALLAVIGGVIAAVLHYFSGLFVLGLLFGFVVLLLGILMVTVPAAHTVWGILTVGLALVSIPFSFAGFLVGFFLALLGGILSILWRPPPSPRTITVTARVVPPPPT